MNERANGRKHHLEFPTQGQLFAQHFDWRGLAPKQVLE
jgi:hypothetical protein